MLLGQLLNRNHGVSPQDIDRALNFQDKYGGRLGAILVNMGIITEDTLVLALAEQLGISTLEEFAAAPPDFASLGDCSILNLPFLLKRKWLPIHVADELISFAVIDPLDTEVLQYLRDLHITWRPILVSEGRFRDLQAEYELARETGQEDSFGDLDLTDTELDKLRELASEAPIVNLVNRLISRAVLRGASDLHCEPYKNMYRIRFRIDGILHDVDFLPLSMQLPVASRIKILAGMDIAERRRPQDGQISTKAASKDLDIRVSTLPLAEGESLVLRFLIKESISYNLDHLGLEPDLIGFLQEDIRKTAGVILLTGPTGSGKSTTLYSCLSSINSEDKKIITIEDPVEYRLEGINQIHVHPEIGYDFAKALRSILRQDPDVIMVGEIRDPETARTAMQSSLTGHLVFSTLHTNDAPTAYTRLIDLGVEEYLINSALISVIAQRLVRKLCDQCARDIPLDPALAASYHLEDLVRRYQLRSVSPRETVGCPACNQTGYRGRVGIMEYLRCTPEIQALPKSGGFPLQAREYMIANHIRSLNEDGFFKYLQGTTSIDEVLRVAAI